jgi:SAM-dependent methyltransferase
MTTPSRSASFFDRYPRLRQTSKVDGRGERLQYRYRALIERNLGVIRGRRVLDLASHDGRWTVAALDAGAIHVTGIEGRGALIQRAIATLEAYGFRRDRYDFLEGDCLNRLEQLDPGSFDTVFCFGFLYHTLRQYDLLSGITELEPDTLLIDSRVVAMKEPAIFVAYNDTRLEGAAIATRQGADTVLVGIPTAAALYHMLDHLGWQVTVQETLHPQTPDGDGIRDYCEGRRLGILATRSRPAVTDTSSGVPTVRRSFL